jgi:hypothetical protein
VAACSDRIPLNVDMGGYDPEVFRRELCRKPACQRLLFPDASPMPTKRDIATKRRRGAELKAIMAERDKKEQYADTLRYISTAALIEELISGAGDGWQRTALRAEIDARIPPRAE